MKHARPDYDRIQDPLMLIPEDEPVFLLRAQDATAPEVLEFWASLQFARDGDETMARMANKHAMEMREWQAANGSKMPDLPGGEGEGER